jgi:hypothetical protein
MSQYHGDMGTMSSLTQEDLWDVENHVLSDRPLNILPQVGGFAYQSTCRKFLTCKISVEISRVWAISWILPLGPKNQGMMNYNRLVTPQTVPSFFFKKWVPTKIKECGSALPRQGKKVWPRYYVDYWLLATLYVGFCWYLSIDSNCLF